MKLNTRPPAYDPGLPNFKDATRCIDAKRSYKLAPMGNTATSASQGSYVPFSSGAPSIPDHAYSGRRIMTGANFRFGG